MEAYGVSPEFIEYARTVPVEPERGSAIGRALRERKVIHIPDVQADPEYNWAEAQRFGSFRTNLGVPMLRDGVPIGAFGLTRSEVRPFTDKEIELVTTFADQAVIALENTRLLNELRESLQQQTATADVLKVISRSAFDLQTVLDTLTESAARLCDADMAGIARRHEDGTGFHHVTNYNFPPDWLEYNKTTRIEPGRGSVVARVLLDGKAVQVADVLADPEYTYFDAQRLGGFRTMLGVPLLRDGQPIGVLSLTRSVVKPFTDKQIELVTTFADQAVIAIENVRLFDEVQARTRDLTESLQQQTATADVLQVISRSTFDLQTVLDTLANSAGRLREAENVQIFLRAGEVYRLAAHNGFSLEYQEYVKQHPIAPGRGTLVARAALQGVPVHIPDVLADPEYTFLEGQRLAGFRAAFGVPLLRQGSCVGVMAMTRGTPHPFTTRQMELVTTFTDQAVIAIENVRLFDEVQERSRELQESLQQQTATADVLKVISRS